MRQRKFRAPPRKTQRRWRVPPALAQGGGETFEGLAVLDEASGEQGLVLWQSLRDALLWGGAPPTERSALFAPAAEQSRLAAMLAAGMDAEMEPPLKVLAAMVGAPEQAREENVGLACRLVAAWADERGKLGTALAFSHAAAVVVPGDPAAAFAVARLARRRAENARAESWYRRTVALARQAGDWPTYALAFLGLGTLYVQRGSFPAARRFYIRAHRAATRNTLHDVEGMALHDLFGIAVETGNAREANALARAAHRAYGNRNPKLPRLAHDVAYFWTTQGEFARALPVLERLAEIVRSPAERLLVFADLARAAGGVGQRELFQTAWDQTWDILQGGETEEEAARALLDLAHGAASLGIWDRAERAAQAALDVATRRNEARVRLAAEAVLDSARHHRQAEVRAARPPAAETGAADTLAEDFMRSLEAYAGAG
ncbi:MAG TPA: tetratricopeptide repeat protein [Longimicrobiaceae bacterium]|nr:tetratricopeptide repeat protein [Longimicrobiaceae bacterium]